MLPTLPTRKQRTEPSIGGETRAAATPPAAPAAPEPPSLVETVSEEEKKRPAPDRIVALRLVPRGAELPAERTELDRNARPSDLTACCTKRRRGPLPVV